MSETLAYIESGIWIARGIGPDDIFYEPSKVFIDEDIESGSIRGIVSLFSLMEAINVIRRRITSNEDRAVLDGKREDGRKEHLKNLTDVKVNILLKYLRTKESENKILFADFSIVDL